MRAYSEASEEALRARKLLKDWAGQGFLSQAQYRLMEQETGCDLRRTNIFLRAVLFLFALIIVGAAVALFMMGSSSGPGAGLLLLVFAAASYLGAELAVSQARLYRYGIEEALAVCSVGFLCAGMQMALFEGGASAMAGREAEFLVPAAGALASLWIWRRFGFAYAFFGAMLMVLWLIADWTSSHAAQHLIVAAFYAAGLMTLIAVRRHHRFTCLDDELSIAEALLWLGTYLAISLQLSSMDLMGRWWGRPSLSPSAQAGGEFSRPFYWATWVLIWCLPPVVLARGLRQKDRFVIAVGVIVAILTLVTNKSYLDWQRHTWDPMLLGGLLIGVALWIRRWLAGAPGEVRHGFTAQRLSGKDKRWMDVGSVAFGLASANAATSTPQAGSSNVHFGGGESGGGGASSDF